jgi:uncharacterized protein YjiS (DUF1127 family)
MSYQSRDRLIAETGLCSTALPPRPGLVRRALLTLTVWRERVRMRRHLAQMDARSLRDAGISPAAAAFESGKPFWREVGGLR